MGDAIDRAAVQSAVRAYLALEDTDAAWEVERIIYALPAVSAPVAVRVKPLEWEGDGHWSVGDNEGWMEEANTPFGWGYSVEFGTFDTGPWIVSSTFGETLTGFDSPDTAKAAAQADYAARIMAAIDAPDVAALVKAAERQMDNMAFVLNHAEIPNGYYSKFIDELEQDRAAIRKGATP